MMFEGKSAGSQRVLVVEDELMIRMEIASRVQGGRSRRPPISTLSGRSGRERP